VNIGDMLPILFTKNYWYWRIYFEVIWKCNGVVQST